MYANFTHSGQLALLGQERGRGYEIPALEMSYYLTTRRIAYGEPLVRQAGVVHAARFRRHYRLLLRQGDDMPCCILRTRAAERVSKRLGRTLVITTLVRRERRSAKG